MYTLIAGNMSDKWGMMGRGEGVEYMTKSPLFIIGAIFHLIVSLLVFAILLFLAMYLWEKVKSERYANRKLGKGK